MISISKTTQIYMIYGIYVFLKAIYIYIYIDASNTCSLVVSSGNPHVLMHHMLPKSKRSFQIYTAGSPDGLFGNHPAMILACSQDGSYPPLFKIEIVHPPFLLHLMSGTMFLAFET